MLLLLGFDGAGDFDDFDDVDGFDVLVVVIEADAVAVNVNFPIVCLISSHFGLICVFDRLFHLMDG